MYFLPELPRWLVAQDCHDDALRVLARLHSKGDVDDPYVQAELKEIIAKITIEKRTPTPSYSTLIFGEEARRTWIGIGVVSPREHTKIFSPSYN
jgi:hypothetical protein